MADQARLPLLALCRLSSLLSFLLAVQLALKGLGQFLVTFPQLQQQGAADTRVQLLTPQNPGFGMLSALLMVAPVTLMGWRWWTETSAAADRA